RIFQEFRADFPGDGHHFLTENFRSVPGVLDFVNALFLGAFPDAGPKLDPGPGTPARDARPAVEFLWAAEPKVAAEKKGKPRENRNLEARWLARRLRQRLDAGWTVRDRETGAPRTADAGDVALLFRAMTDVGPFERALYEEGF